MEARQEPPRAPAQLSKQSLAQRGPWMGRGSLFTCRWQLLGGFGKVYLAGEVSQLWQEKALLPDANIALQPLPYQASALPQCTLLSSAFSTPAAP